MTNFPGFPPGKIRHIRIPNPFFTDLMPAVDSLAEIKVMLYAFWFMEQQEEVSRFITFEDFSSDSLLMESLGDEPHTALSEALKKATQRGFFLQACQEGSTGSKSFYFINTPRGRAAVQAIQTGKWKSGPDMQVPASLKVERPNIYRLYEENIGPLTPLIADILITASQEYQESWIEEAFSIAVQKNARNWRYIEAILKGWQEKGKNETNRRDHPENRRRYIEGEYGDLIEH
jgi:DNA replication protein